MIRLAGFEWKSAGTKQIVYVGADNHLYELSRLGREQVAAMGT
jgi:hypothetical protein